MEQVNQIKILTLNLFIRPPLIKNNYDDYKQERLDEFLKILPNYDIICLQELFDLFSDRKAYLIKKAIKLGFIWIADNQNPSFIFSKYLLDSGILILSKFPIVFKQFTPFKCGYLIDGVAMKGFIFCKIKINNNQYLHLYNTHLQAQYMNLTQEQNKFCVQTKLQQINEIKQQINSNLNKFEFQNNDICILVGDLNIDARTQQNIGCFIDQISYKTEYQQMIEILQGQDCQIIDCVKQKYQESPITYGDISINYLGEEIPKETDLCEKDDLCRKLCLDYILHLIPNGKKFNENDENLLRVNYFACIVQQFQLQNKTPRYVSDHYGLEIQINKFTNIL